MDNNRKKIKYYSQNGEDYLMWNLFDYKKTGFYVEVGAFDGIHFSNTYSFEEFGWKGICIEPHPKFFPHCIKNRPNSICLNVACVESDSITEVNFKAEEIGLLSGISLDEDDIKKRYSKRKLDFTGFEKIRVTAQTLTKILDENSPNQAIDFISIDVEGTELDVIKGLDFDRYSPRVIIVEVNSERQDTIIREYLEKKNKYKFARKMGSNIAYVLSEEDADKISSINLNNCILTETKHPSGEKYSTRPHHRLKSKIVNHIKRIVR